jgi:hypothetical protein
VSGVGTSFSIPPGGGNLGDSGGIRSYDAKQRIPRYLSKPSIAMTSNGIAGSDPDSTQTATKE